MQKVLAAFSARVAENPTKIAITDADLLLTYAQLDEQSSALAAVYGQLGFKPGDVALCVKRKMSTNVVALLAGIKSGVVHIVLDGRDSEVRRTTLQRATAAKVLIADDPADTHSFDGQVLTPADWSSEHGGTPNQTLTPADPCWYEATSGSTGAPKIVMNTRGFLEHLTYTQLTAAGLRSDDEIAWFGELWSDTLLGGLLVGATCHAYDLRGLGVSDLEGWMRTRKITAIQTYVAAFRALAGACKAPLPDLRLIRLAGEVVWPKDVRAFQALCPKTAELHNYYGMTECGFMSQHVQRQTDPLPEGPLSIGVPALGTAFRLLDEANRPVPTGVAGRLMFRSPILPAGYLQDPERSALTYQTDADGTPLLNTGDVAVQDADGRYRIVGRADDQVKIRGYAVRYAEVEDTLERHPSILKALVTSVMLPSDQRVLVAHVIPAQPGIFDEATVKTWMLDSHPAYMVPNYYLTHQAFPKTDTGKISRRLLPDPFEGAGAAAVTDVPSTPTQARIAQVWTKVLGHSQFGMRDDFFDIGGDSLQAMAMVLAVEEALKLRVGYESLIMQGASIAEIADRIDSMALVPQRTVPLKRAAGGLPLFVLPVENGEFSDWLYMLPHLPSEMAVIGVHTRDPKAKRFDRAPVSELARFAADAILATEPDGPILIGGFSAGTQLALETVRQLQTSGEEVAGLLMLDPPLAEYEPDVSSWRWRRVLSPSLKRGDLGLSLNRAGHLLFGSPSRERHFADEVAFWTYTPVQVDPVPTLLVSAIDNTAHKDAREAFWINLLRQPEVAQTPGMHNEIVRDPNAIHLAKIISDWWDRLTAEQAVPEREKASRFG